MEKYFVKFVGTLSQYPLFLLWFDFLSCTTNSILQTTPNHFSPVIWWFHSMSVGDAILQNLSLPSYFGFISYLVLHIAYFKIHHTYLQLNGGFIQCQLTQHVLVGDAILQNLSLPLIRSFVK